MILPGISILHCVPQTMELFFRCVRWDQSKVLYSTLLSKYFTSNFPDRQDALSMWLPGVDPSNVLRWFFLLPQEAYFMHVLISVLLFIQKEPSRFPEFSLGNSLSCPLLTLTHSGKLPGLPLLHHGLETLNANHRAPLYVSYLTGIMITVLPCLCPESWKQLLTWSSFVISGGMIYPILLARLGAKQESTVFFIIVPKSKHPRCSSAINYRWAVICSWNEILLLK